MRRLLLGVLIGACVLSLHGLVHGQAAEEDAAEIVLVGAADSTDLQRVVNELLTREGVGAVFQRAERFSPEALLAAPDRDRRVRVFITLPTSQLARLYMRGPYGQRFLLRELTLRNGIDELGRESIAHVAATSTHALLHSSVGIDRDAVRADLDRQGVDASSATGAVTVTEPAAVNATQATDSPLAFGIYVGLRDAVRWTGSDLGVRWGAGGELGLSEQGSPHWMFRQRLVLEHAVAQSLDVVELLSYVRGTALRLGQDVALVSGVHRGVLGVAAGVDVLRITPQRAGDPSWSLTKAYTDVVPVVRAELRYELALPWVFAALSVHADAALRSLRLSVRDGMQERAVAQVPWLSPGLALSLGWHSD